MSNTTVAATILRQLGGMQFVAITGAKDLLCTDNSLSMRVAGKGEYGRVNKVVIRLDPSDTYTVQAYDVVRFHPKLRYETDDIYCDVLAEVFERVTGLKTSLRA